MPSDIGCSGHERDIVQVDNLPPRSMGAMNFTRGEWVMYLQLQFKLRLSEYQPVVIVGLVLVTNPSILRYCRINRELKDHPKQCARRHCRCSRSSTHQKRSASSRLLLIWFL